MEGQWKRINPELTKMLHQAILNLCCKMYTSEAGLEVDGIICVSAVDSSEQQVVKIHEILKKDDSSADILREKGTMGLYISSKEQVKSNKVILTESECRVASPKDSSDLKEKKRKRKLSENDVQSHVNNTPSKMYVDSPLEMTVDLVDQNDSSADQSKESFTQGHLSIETGENFSRVTLSGCDETYSKKSGKERVVSPTLSTSQRRKGRRKKTSPRHVTLKSTIAYKTDSPDHHTPADTTGQPETDTGSFNVKVSQIKQGTDGGSKCQLINTQSSLPFSSSSNRTSATGSWTGSAEKNDKVGSRMKASHQEIILIQNKHDSETKTQEAQTAFSESDQEGEHSTIVTKTRLVSSEENSWRHDLQTHASDLMETDASSSYAQNVQIKQEINDESYNMALNKNVQSSLLNSDLTCNSGKELWTSSGIRPSDEAMHLTQNKPNSETKRQYAKKVSSESDQEVELDTIIIKTERVDSVEDFQQQELDDKSPKDNDCPHLASLLSKGTHSVYKLVENTMVQSRSSSEDSREGSSPKTLIQSNSDQEWLMKVTANAYRYQNSLMKKGTVPVSPHVGISSAMDKGSGTSSPDNKEVLARLAGSRSSSNSPLPSCSSSGKKESTRLESRYPALYNQLQKAKSPNRKSSTLVTQESSSLLSRLPFISFQELFPHTPSRSSSLSDTRTQFNSSATRIKRKGHMKYTMPSETRDSDWTPNEDEENDIEWKASTKVRSELNRGQQAQSVSVRTRLSTGTKARQIYTEEEDDDVDDVEEVEEMEDFDDYDRGGRDQMIVASVPIPVQEDNFTCGLCGLQFNQEYRWQFHMTKVHGLKTEDRGGI
ncbi:hypothetical protein CHS0354_030534 [Potamilus streckersoni]|uniref:C2H2-type domain-containing protein n=1 Tax=Potamilus streckersoni TaxID=2493646 RepID=A0AAE0RPP6_9BIVA|nr:hypothetical protein CHS0354_030534 [Potamilus streckersoni]